MGSSSLAMEPKLLPLVDRERIRRTESRFEGTGRASLFRCSWLPPSPRLSVALVHGFGEHSLRYDPLGVWFARRGIAVHAFDLRGHGRSPGRRGHVNRFDEYLDDLAIFLDRIREEAPEQSVSLVGHSLGGLIVTAFLVRERQPRLLCAAVSGAALALSPDLSRSKILLARLVRKIAPRLSMDAGIDSSELSSVSEVVRSYDDDPHVQGRMTACHATEMFAAIDRTRRGAPAVDVPFLLLHGERDRLCLKTGSEMFHANILTAASGGVGGVETDLKIYPGLKHEIFNESEKEAVFADVLDWLLRFDAEASEAQ